MMLRLLILTSIACTSPHFQSGGATASGAASIRLACAAVEQETDPIRLKCDLHNQSDGDIFVLLSDAALDGPIGSANYVDRLAGGERYENVLQFGSKTGKGLDRGGMSHPWVDLTNDDLRRLQRIVAGSPMSIEISADIGAIGPNSQLAEIVVRLKLIYVRETRLRSVQRRADLPDQCRALLDTVLRHDEGRAPVSGRIGTRRVEPGLRMLTDGCHDKISEQCEHVYSEVMAVGRSVVRDGGPG